MKSVSDLDRREFLVKSGAGIVSLVLVAGCGSDDPSTGTVYTQTTSLPTLVTAETGTTTTETGSTGSTNTGECVETDGDIKGPFYESDAPVGNDLDIHDEKGVRLMVTGLVLDVDCNPIRNAVIELWHADTAGDYDDTATMKYRGQFATDDKGAYWFRSIVPGRYLNGAEFRPAHLHIKIWVDGIELLTTQLYFSGDPYNKNDDWYDVKREMAMTKTTDEWTSTFDFVVD
jgi:protocatechuate 3,4-dioxygenase beta subunit